MQPRLCRREEGLTSLRTTSLIIGQHLNYGPTPRAEVVGQTSEPHQAIPTTACPAEQGIAMAGSFAEKCSRNSNSSCERADLS